MRMKIILLTLLLFINTNAYPKKVTWVPIPNNSDLRSLLNGYYVYYMEDLRSDHIDLIEINNVCYGLSDNMSVSIVNFNPDTKRFSSMTGIDSLSSRLILSRKTVSSLLELSEKCLGFNLDEVTIEEIRKANGMSPESSRYAWSTCLLLIVLVGIIIGVTALCT